MEKGAIFDDERKYRYVLTRSWDLNKSSVLFIMLNPSTADEKDDDPTIRRCISFAKDWGYGSLSVANLYAYRTKDPKELKLIFNSIGEDNNYWLHTCAYTSNLIVAAWGSHDFARYRVESVLQLLNEHKIYCLGITKRGFPKHPLYLKKDTKPIIYRRSI